MEHQCEQKGGIVQFMIKSPLNWSLTGLQRGSIFLILIIHGKVMNTRPTPKGNNLINSTRSFCWVTPLSESGSSRQVLIWGMPRSLGGTLHINWRWWTCFLSHNSGLRHLHGAPFPHLNQRQQAMDTTTSRNSWISNAGSVIVISEVQSHHKSHTQNCLFP
jgi:hypothetical protein